MVGFVASIWLRAPFKVDVLRDRGALGRVVDDGFVENVYRVQIMNATEADQTFTVFVDNLSKVKVDAPAQIIVGPAEARWVPLSVRVPPEVAQVLGTGAHPVEVVVTRQRQGDEPERAVRENTTFMVPR
jgi:polyferredoxin